MARYATKAVKNLYYQARIRAAQRDDTFGSRISAAEAIGTSSTRLYAIETGMQNPHRDELIVMSDVYDAPELLEQYCENCCPVGERCKRREK